MMDGLDIIEQKITLKNYKMKKILILSALIISALCNCKDKNTEIIKSDKIAKNIDTSEVNDVSHTENLQLDLLKYLEDICVEDDGVFKNCDELFTKDGSSLFFIIVPKTGASKWYLNQTKNLKGEIYEVNNQLTDKIKKIKKENLSKEFNIWVFYTDKKYTEFVGLDSPYNFKTPRIVNLYRLIPGENNWEMIDSFDVKNNIDEEKESEWQNAFIDKTIIKSNKNETILNNNLISNKWIGKYSTYFSYGKIGGDNAGWSLEIEIKEGEIKATGDGYQISFTDLLTANENKNELTLNHLKNIFGYKLGANMNPEFTIIEDNGKYYVKSKWIDGDIITKSDKFGYKIDKELK